MKDLVLDLQIDKIQIENIKPSSRQNPYIRFDFEKKLHRNAVELTKLSAGYDDEVVFKDLSIIIEAGEKVAIIGPNGIGKTTLLKTLVGHVTPLSGALKWAGLESVDLYRSLP